MGMSGSSCRGATMVMSHSTVVMSDSMLALE